MPAYNEELTITAAVADVAKYVTATVSDMELIVVDDGSKDRTAAIIRELQKSHPSLKLIQQANAGHGAALRRGMEEATGDWLLLLDSDCQIGLEDFASHWESRATYDAFLGVRKPRHDPPARLVISFLMRNALWLMAGVSPRDAGAPYKLVSRPMWLSASGFISEKSWIPSVLLAAFALRSPQLRVMQLPIRHYARPHGQSTLNAQRIARFCWHALRDIRDFATRMASDLGHSRVPDYNE